MSHLDLTITSTNLSYKCEWEVLPQKFGSDHFPNKINFPIGNVPGINNNSKLDNESSFLFNNLDWEKFVNTCEQNLNEVLEDENPETFYEKFMACLKKNNTKLRKTKKEQ